MFWLGGVWNFNKFPDQVYRYKILYIPVFENIANNPEIRKYLIKV